MTHKKGFSLIETLIAVLLLSMSVGALMTVVTGGLFSIRYARNQIVAGNLAQEALEYIKNTKDTATQLGTNWEVWQNQVLLKDQLGTGLGCFSSNGCYLDAYTLQSTKISSCGGQCPWFLLFEAQGVYGYQTTYPLVQGGTTSFRRSIYVRPVTDPNQIEVTVELRWLNGNLPRSMSQTMLLTNWTP